ncbi:MAG: [Ribosomal protein S18]-alanine N-acetyltransferase [Candidatus Celerinatantimonas neptuna]|nr:MAG: [Ribosomal protein S18]-alanine N-acetyltransferase [Candidatus Celerinatantimonas neptuna]
MMNYQVDKLESSDLSQIMAIEQRVQHHPWNESLLQQSFNHLSYNLALRGKESDLLGYLFCRVVVDEGELLNISIDRNLQHQGWGGHLLRSLIIRLKMQGIHRIMLEVRASNQPALRLYKRLGFNLDGVRKNYYPSGDTREDALLMSRIL